MTLLRRPLRRRLTGALLLLLAAGLGSWVARELVRLAWASPRLPQWDMAKYGVDGLRLARAVRDGELWTFLVTIHEMDVWPPLFPFLEMPVFLLFGSEYRVPSVLVGVLFGATVVAAAWAGWSLVAPRRGGLSVGIGAASSGSGEAELPSGGTGLEPAGWVAGAVAAALFATSPLFQVLGTVVMLEVPGALVLCLAVGAYARSLGSAEPRDPAALRAFRAACLLATLLFFTKYNYGLLWLAPMLVHEAWRHHGGLRPALSRLAAAVRRLDLRRPWPAFVGLWVLALLAVVVTGGWTLELGGAMVEVHSIGNGLYALCLLAVARALLRLGRRARFRPAAAAASLRERLAVLPPRGRVLLLWVAVPIGLWLLLPGHLPELVAFVQNRSSGLPPLGRESLLLYPRAFADELAAWPAVGIASLVVGLAPAALLPRLGGPRAEPLRALALAVAVAAVALVLHPYKLPRFASTLAVLAWLSCGAVAGLGWDRLSRRWPPAARAAGALALAVLLLAGAALTGTGPERLRAGHRVYSVSGSIRPLLDRLADESAGWHGATLAGYWNHLSPGLVEWHLARRYPEVPRERLLRDLRDLAGAEPAAAVEELARSPEIERVLVLVLPRRGLAWTPEAARELSWTPALRRVLAADPRFERGGATRFERSGYVLAVFRRRAADPDPGASRNPGPAAPYRPAGGGYRGG